MAGIATQFEILQKTRDRLASSGDAALEQIAGIIDAHPKYAHLGALGPAIADFLPAELPRVPFADLPKNYALVWKMFAAILADSSGLYKLLGDLRSMLDTLSTIADAEDTGAICALKDTDFTTRMSETASNFQDLVTSLMPDLATGSGGLVLQIADTIITGLKPSVLTDSPGDTVPPPDTWPMRDFMHWKGTGEFTANLLKLAEETGNDEFKAYAYGYVCAYASCVCTTPFTNSSTGGPARTQWWRRRFVNNYVDAWVHGYYGASASMAGDAPSPGYDSWPNLCSSNLHERIQMNPIDPAALLMTLKTEGVFSDELPASFRQLWFSAFEQTYGVGAAAGRFTPESLNGAYLMTWLKLWYRTSGAVFGCDPPAPGAPPDDCGDSPGELDPFTPTSSGGPTLPPEPEIDYHEDEATKVCGILLAILGGLLLLGGGIAGGAAAIAGAVELLDCDSVLVVNWKKLRCDLHWYRIYIHNAHTGLHQLLKFAGFEYPYARELSVDEEVLELLGVNLPFESGKSVVKSRVLGEVYPSKAASASLTDFNSRPTASNPGIERPPSITCLSEVYPSFFVDDDAANPLSNGDVKTPATDFPFRSAAATGPAKRPIVFGNAVANAVDLLKHMDSFPNWNLDADRGLAYVTWAFRNARYDADNVEIDPA